VRVSDASAAAARSRLLAGRLDVAVSLRAGRATAEVKRSLDGTTRALLQSALDELHLRAGLAAAHIPLAAVLPALTPVAVRTKAISPPPREQAARAVAAIAAGLLMYIVLALYGSAVASGVAQEKTSRTAELLLATMRSRDLLAGKVLGIGVVGLGQLTVAALAGLVANAVIHSASIPGSVWALLPAFLVYFLLGFMLYAFAFAAAGALVARQEELQFIAMPFGLVLLLAYLLVYAAIGSPDATWLRIVSWVPPLTATLMPARIALGHVALWEYPLEALLMLGSLLLVSRVAARVYARALVQGGARVRWGEALRRAR